MIKWRLKSCPRCGGDMYFDELTSYRYRIKQYTCLQCSHAVETNPPVLNNNKPYTTLRKYARI